LPSNFVLILFEQGAVIATENYLSKGDLWEAIDSHENDDFAGIEWMELSEDCKMIWILRDNMSYSEETDLDLLMLIYSHLFDNDEEWRNKYI
tara:strand:+ start:328 stop:603 length:276 start_codon:yes stop_codon:yes gene_type:complete